MRLLFKAKYIILSLLFVVALLVGTKYGWLVQRFTFSKALQNGLIVSELTKNNLQRCLRTCDTKDKEFAYRLLAIEAESEDRTDGIPEHRAEIQKVLSEATNNYIETGAVRSAVEMHVFALHFGEAMDARGSRDSSFMNEVYLGVEKLAVKYPRNGHVYFALGTALFQKNPRDERAISAFKKCILILPTEDNCLAGYAKAVSAFTTPRCVAKNFRPGTKISYVSDVAEEPSVTLLPEDIRELTPEANSTYADAVTLYLNQSGAAKQFELSKQERIKSIHLNLEEVVIASAIFNKEVLTSSPVLGVESLSENEKTVFEKICIAPETFELPKNLRI